MDCFNEALTTFLGFERVSCVAVYTGSESSCISSKIPYFVLWRWTKVDLEQHMGELLMTELSFLGELTL